MRDDVCARETPCGSAPVPEWAGWGGAWWPNHVPACPVRGLARTRRRIRWPRPGPTWPPSRHCAPGSAGRWWSTCAAGDEDFLAVATPGAGKTTFALRIAAELLADRHRRGGHGGHADRAPQDAVGPGRGAVGIQLDPTFRNADVHTSADFHGAVVTYAQVGMAPAVHRRRTMARPTLVILDEIHHAGDSRSWGDGVKSAFEPAVRRLMLTGTPFRSDDNPIPFVDLRAGRRTGCCGPARTPRTATPTRWPTASSGR